MDIEAKIASWIKAARNGAGLSGDALATRLSFELGGARGNTKANISHWETGKHSPSLEQLLAIVKVTGKGLPEEVIRAMVGDGEIPATQAAGPALGEVVSAAGAQAEASLSLDQLVFIRAINDKEAAILRRYRVADQDSARMIEVAASVARPRGLGVVDSDQAEQGPAGAG
nr:helix-turn-helix transcriptional regulator [uncultured Duganella sp.]